MGMMIMSAAASTATGATAMLLCRVSGRACALPLAHVVETMRPLFIESFAGAPSFVLGLSRIRGEHVPVIDLGRLLGSPDEASASRFVLLRVGSRCVAARVGAVLGVGALQDDAALALPPLLREADGPVAALAARDAELLLVLKAARLLDAASELSMQEKADA
jgi:purine-binding chemotaxis protein CheW